MLLVEVLGAQVLQVLVLVKDVLEVLEVAVLAGARCGTCLCAGGSSGCA